MIGSIIRRVRRTGVRETYRYAGKLLAWHLSPNYKQNPEQFSSMGVLAFVGYLAFDGIRKALDNLAHSVDVALNGRSDIPRAVLEEFEIRLLRRDLLDKNSIVYAFGVSNHIETEELLAARVGCTVYMFDPTPPALEYIKSRTLDPRLIFDPIGVWIESGPLRFYTDRRSRNKNLSVVNMYHTDSYIEAPCYTLADIMKKYGHTRLDVLKMDIEGSALPVLLHMIEHTPLRPRQIVGALEKPQFAFDATFAEVLRVIRDKGRLFRALEREGYKIVTHRAAEFTAVRSEP